MSDLSSAAKANLEAARQSDGKFGTQPHSNPGQLNLGAAPAEDPLGDLDTIAERYLLDGTLREVRAQPGAFQVGGARIADNTERRLKTGQRLMGRSADGGRIYGEVELRRQTGEHRTTSLDERGDVWCLSVTYTHVPKRARYADEIGRGVGEDDVEGMAETNALARGMHLSTMRAGTAAQNEQAARIHAEEQNIMRAQDRCMAEIEPDNGYRYGSAWLVDDLDPDKVSRVLDVFSGLPPEED